MCHQRQLFCCSSLNVKINIRCSIVVSISACHGEDPGSIPGGGISAAVPLSTEDPAGFNSRRRLWYSLLHLVSDVAWLDGHALAHAIQIFAKLNTGAQPP